MLKSVAHGNGVTVTHGLDPHAMRRPGSIATSGVTGTPGNWASGAYAYDGAGNITRIGQWRYTYDAVSRLKNGWNPRLPDPPCPPPYWCDTNDSMQTFSYDPFGNLTDWNWFEGDAGSGATMTTSTATNRLSEASYDDAGNLTSWGGTSTAWYPTNELRAALGFNINDLYGYTADSERIVVYNELSTDPAGKFTITLRDLSGKVLRAFQVTTGQPGTWTEKQDWITRDGQLLATVDTTVQGGVARHVHLDHLGTPRLITSASGAGLESHTYLPFGLEVTEVGPLFERMKFTGHERDLASGLDYMHARYYSSYVNRFLSVDKDNARPGFPQTWNRYSYSLNNPVRYIDPNGENAWDFVAGIGNGLTSSLLLNNLRQTPVNSDFANGQAVGDLAALAVSVAETGLGMGAGGASLAAELETAGAATPVAVPAATLGAGMVVHGVVSQGVAVSNLVKFAGEKTGHAQQRQAEAQDGDAHRQVGDPNRVKREGRQFIDRDTGNTVYVNGNRVVIYDSEGNLVSQFTNSRSNTARRIEAGRWNPVTDSASGPKE